ncbi:NADPH-dependent oxidoreductase [Streptomyces sp. YC537]|uniref:NADPH-dependent oxidoreductase n=2 Tax=Streptomyces boluensis TaxID=1775135 RepID=A0A964V0P4_9ACTN|nr:NADPH-dependent oxidoreductase [Streptomyces boluensis]
MQEPTQEPLTVTVIVGSTREGRVGGTVARWFLECAAHREDLELNLVDLLDYEDLPARYPLTPTEAMLRFTRHVDRADGFVVVTPEYNRSFPAGLKQAIDFAYDEWHAKPVGFVSYGYSSHGLHAVEQLRAVFTELHAMSLRDSVGLNLVDELPRGPESRAVTTMLDQLVWWGRALREARATDPYPC